MMIRPLLFFLLTFAGFYLILNRVGEFATWRNAKLIGYSLLCAALSLVFITAIVVLF